MVVYTTLYTLRWLFNQITFHKMKHQVLNVSTVAFSNTTHSYIFVWFLFSLTYLCFYTTFFILNVISGPPETEDWGEIREHETKPSKIYVQYLGVRDLLDARDRHPPFHFPVYPWHLSCFSPPGLSVVSPFHPKISTVESIHIQKFQAVQNEGEFLFP